MPPKVVVTNWLHKEIYEYLEQHAHVQRNDSREPWDRKTVIDTCSDAVAMLAFMTDHVDATFLDACPNLRMIGCALKGYDNFDIEACRSRGITVSFVPDLLTEPTAELGVGLMIALARNVIEGDDYVRSGQFNGWRPRFYGTGLAESSVGIIGMGAVGQAMARRLIPFGCTCLYSDPRPLAAEKEKAMQVQRVSTQAIAEQCDFVVIAAPLVDGAKHLVNAAFLQTMKPGAFLINVGRGSIVDESAVAEALEQNHLGGYAADVFEMEDWARTDRPATVHSSLTRFRDRTVLTPHIGSAVDSVRFKIGMRAARNIVQFLSGERPDDDVSAARATGT